MLSIIIHNGVDHELAMAYGDEFEANEIPGYPLRNFAEQTGLNPRLVSSRIKMLCTKIQESLNTHTIDLTLSYMVAMPDKLFMI